MSWGWKDGLNGRCICMASIDEKWNESQKWKVKCRFLFNGKVLRFENSNFPKIQNLGKYNLSSFGILYLTWLASWLSCRSICSYVCLPVSLPAKYPADLRVNLKNNSPCPACYLPLAQIDIWILALICSMCSQKWAWVQHTARSEDVMLIDVGGYATRVKEKKLKFISRGIFFNLPWIE